MKRDITVAVCLLAAIVSLWLGVGNLFETAQNGLIGWLQCGTGFAAALVGLALSGDRL